MNEQKRPGGDFEERLLARLKAVVADRGAEADRQEAENASTATPAWRRSGPRVALGCGFALAALAVGLIVGAGSNKGSTAFAVEPQDGGGVTIKVYSLTDAAGLEEALEDAGIRAQVTWLPAGMVCKEPHYTPSIVHVPGGGAVGSMSMGGPGGGMTFGVGSTEAWRRNSGKYIRGEISNEEMRDSVPNFNLDPAAFRPDQSVVISGAPAPYRGDPEGGSIASLGVAEGKVEPCEPVPAPPDGLDPFGHPSPAGGPGYVPKGDEALSQNVITADLQRAADAAADSDTQVEAPPGPGQYLYTKTEEAHLEAWDPDGPPSGSKTKPRYFTDRQLRSVGMAMPALVPTLKEVWTAPDGTTRERETLGRVEFLSSADQSRWEEAGSPPPFEYDPAEHHVGKDGSGRPVKDYAAKAFRGRHEFEYMSRLSELPTEPEALRLALENRHGGSSTGPSPADTPRGGGTVETLLRILSEPIASSALRAAAFEALAEIPGIGFEQDVVDVAGRRGDAIGWVRDIGFGRRYIFDPETGGILADAEVIYNAKAAEYPTVPDGTVFRETAHLRTGIVDSTGERPGS